MARFSRFAWLFLGYLLLVILFGAWVRISGSGAGCGTHWPLCQGEVIPPSPGVKTMVEFTHRITSGLSGLFGLGLLVWSWRLGDRRVFGATGAMFAFLLIEGFVGAVLVKKELVAGDASTSRAIVVALHLANTMLLTACAAAMAWRASPPRSAGMGGARFSRAALAMTVLLMIATNSTGAVTALGDTLFPVQPALDGGLLARVRDDLSASHHFLVRLRVLHPIVAMAAVVLAGGAMLSLYQRTRLRLARMALHALGGQAALGFLNVALGAPAWMQLVHLLAAQAVWILTFLAVTEAWGSDVGEADAADAASAVQPVAVAGHR